MEHDGLRFIVLHQAPYVRPLEAAIGYVDGSRLGQNADTTGPDQYVDDGFDESWFADLPLDDLTQFR